MQSTRRTENAPADASRVVAIALEALAVGWLMREPLRGYRHAERVAVINKATGHLVRAAVDFAFERGRTRLVLEQPGPADARDVDFIRQSRRRGDAALATALDALPNDTARSMRTRLDALLDSHAAVVRLRDESDAAAVQRREARDPQHGERWFAAASRLLSDIEAVTADALLDPAVREIGVLDFLDIKLESLRMREAAGAELSHLATANARGAGLHADERNRALTGRLRAMLAWDRLERLAAKADNPRLSKAVDLVRRHYVHDFGELRERALAAPPSGAPDGMSMYEYAAHRLSALESLGTLIEAAAALAESRSDARRERARSQIAIFGMLDQMNAKLVGVLKDVHTSIATVQSAAHEIADGNHDLSQRTEEQASSLEETASSMEELTSTVKQNADNARHAKELAAGTSGVASQGGAVVEKGWDEGKR